MSDGPGKPAGTYRELVESARTEYEQIQKELKEIAILIRQSAGEVEKLSQRSAQLTSKMRQMEANLDTYPRQDIRDVYSATQETQMRLFMMRGQVEQLQGKQENLSRYGSLLRRVMEASAGDPAAPSAASGGAGGQNISLLARVIESQERERQRLARQMHDGPAQSLTNLILQAEICERLFGADMDRARVELIALKNSVNETFQKVREFIFDLRPMMLDDLGLAPTLRRYLHDFGEKHNLTINLHLVGEERRQPAHVEVTIFRVIQSLLNNIQEHANASNVQVSLELQPGSVITRVEDDGSGFNVQEALDQASQKRHVGLTAIREQVEMLGGRVQIESEIGQGSRASIVIPVT
jgi:two-component system, NarL family, sensor histidine kinase DegS